MCDPNNLKHSFETCAAQNTQLFLVTDFGRTLWGTIWPPNLGTEIWAPILVTRGHKLEKFGHGFGAQIGKIWFGAQIWGTNLGAFWATIWGTYLGRKFGAEPPRKI